MFEIACIKACGCCDSNHKCMDLMLDKESIFAALAAGDPPAADAGIFGAQVSLQDAALVLLPVGWDTTASYQRGTARGPAAMVPASHQLDLFDHDFGDTYRLGIHMFDRLKVPQVFSRSGAEINAASAVLNRGVAQWSMKFLQQEKTVAVLGGDHSCPFGLIKSLDSLGESFGILHIDAHHDLRIAYEGYEHSHASIMYNALTACTKVEKLVSVGIRDYSQEERSFAEANSDRIVTFYDRDIGTALCCGKPFADISTAIIEALPERVYISFDIDGLDPTLCPGTGTPVPGGLSYRQVEHLLAAVVKSGKRVIGFDLCEVAPREGDGEWNANVGARILYKLCGTVAASRRR